MAERKSPAGAADFVAKIVKDPKNPPATLMLTGYIGASSEDGHTRLYFDTGLSNYVEIPNDAILHTAPVENDGLGASYVWIKRDAVLVYGPAGAERPKGTFLEGPIMQQHLGAAAAVAGPINPRSDFVACQSWICPPSPHCPPSDFVPCQSWICPPSPHCPKSDFAPCQSWICPPTPRCPPHITAPPFCPILSAPGACPSVVGCPPQSLACQVGPEARPHQTLVCPSWAAPCQTQPVFCPPTPIDACPTRIHCNVTVAHQLCAAPAGRDAAPAVMSMMCSVACHTVVQCGFVPQTLAGPCITHQGNCISHVAPCQTPLCSWAPPCPTAHFPCPTHQVHCPSVVHICPVTAVCQAQA